MPEHARRVYRGIFKRSKRATELLHRAFLTCMEDKELHLYTFVRKLMDEGPGFPEKPVGCGLLPRGQSSAAHERRVREATWLHPFFRVQRRAGSGDRAKKSSPPPAAKPLLQSLCQRILFYLRQYTQGPTAIQQRPIPNDAGRQPAVGPAGEEELCFRALWKRFYETVAIRERENPRCQNTFLPKRYRGTMTEFLPLDYERQQQNLPSSHDVANGAIIRMIDSIELPPTTSLPEHSI